jgi:hypothetical protein
MASSTSTKSERDYLLDTFRGLMLILILIDHYPFFFEYTYQPFGFFSAAEGFYYLSGFVFGLVYIRYVSSPQTLLKKAVVRIGKMYKYHVLIFALLLIEHLFLQKYFGVNVSATYDYFDSNRFQGILHFLTLLYYPFLFNIIPIYMLFFVFAPFVLIAFNNNKIWMVLAISGLVWAVSNYISNPNFYLDPINTNVSTEIGTFNPISWQFIFILGIYFGFRRSQKRPVIFKPHWNILAIVICLTLFIIRRIPAVLDIEYFGYAFADGRNLVMPLRLLNFMAFVYLIAWVTKNIKLKRRNFLAFIGSYSIYVFSFHILLIYNVVKLTSTLEHLPVYVNFILAFLLIWSLTLPAYFKENMKVKNYSLNNWKTYFMLFPKEFKYLILWPFNGLKYLAKKPAE